MGVLSLRMCVLGWAIENIDGAWDVMSTIGMRSFTYKDGDWDVSPIPLIVLEETCKKFDWTWPMSDCPLTNRRGMKAQGDLEAQIGALGLNNEEIKDLQDKYCGSTSGAYQLYV